MLYTKKRQLRSRECVVCIFVKSAECAEHSSADRGDPPLHYQAAATAIPTLHFFASHTQAHTCTILHMRSTARYNVKRMSSEWSSVWQSQ